MASSEDYNCPICLDLLLEPVVGACGHEFCRDCYGQWLSRSRTYPSCPLCRVPLSMSVPGVSRRLAELIEVSFPDKTRQRRNAREQDKLTKTEAGGSAGMIPPSLWRNRADLQEHDGAVPIETYRVLIPPGHTQLEDSSGLSSPYTGSPADSLISPTRSPRQGLVLPTGQAGQSYADDTALSPTQSPFRSHDFDPSSPLTPSDYNSHLLANGTAGLPGPEASALHPRLQLPFEDSPEPPPESVTHNSSSSPHERQQLSDVQPPNLGWPAHRLTSARHRPYYRHVRSDSLASEENWVRQISSLVLPRSGSSADMSGFMRTLSNRLAAASEQLGSVPSEHRGQPNGGHTTSSAPAAARASTVALRSDANVGHAYQSAPRNEDSEIALVPWTTETRHIPAASASNASLPELPEGSAPANTSFAETMPSPSSLPFTMGVRRHSPARSSRRSQGMVSSATMNPPRFRNRMHNRSRRSSR